MPLGVKSAISKPKIPPEAKFLAEMGEIYGIHTTVEPKSRKPRATFPLSLEDKQLVIDCLHTWQSAYRKNYRNRVPQTVRDWTRVERILTELEGEG